MDVGFSQLRRVSFQEAQLTQELQTSNAGQAIERVASSHALKKGALQSDSSAAIPKLIKRPSSSKLIKEARIAGLIRSLSSHCMQQAALAPQAEETLLAGYLRNNDAKNALESYNTLRTQNVSLGIHVHIAIFYTQILESEWNVFWNQLNYIQESHGTKIDLALLLSHVFFQCGLKYQEKTVLVLDFCKLHKVIPNPKDIVGLARLLKLDDNRCDVLLMVLSFITHTYFDQKIALPQEETEKLNTLYFQLFQSATHNPALMQAISEIIPKSIR